jgi:hypothetical protein
MSRFKQPKALLLSMSACVIACAQFAYAQPAAVAADGSEESFNYQWAWWSYSADNNILWLWTIAPGETEYGWSWISSENNKIKGHNFNTSAEFDMAEQIGLAPNSLVGQSITYNVSDDVTETLEFTSPGKVTITIVSTDKTIVITGYYGYATSSRSGALLVVDKEIEGVAESGIVAGYVLDFTSDSVGTIKYSVAASANIPEGTGVSASRYFNHSGVAFTYGPTE